MANVKTVHYEQFLSLFTKFVKIVSYKCIRMRLQVANRLLPEIRLKHEGGQWRFLTLKRFARVLNCSHNFFKTPFSLLLHRNVISICFRFTYCFSVQAATFKTENNKTQNVYYTTLKTNLQHIVFTYMSPGSVFL